MHPSLWRVSLHKCPTLACSCTGCDITRHCLAVVWYGLFLYSLIIFQKQVDRNSNPDSIVDQFITWENYIVHICLHLWYTYVSRLLWNLGIYVQCLHSGLLLNTSYPLYLNYLLSFTTSEWVYSASLFLHNKLVFLNPGLNIHLVLGLSLMLALLSCLLHLVLPVKCLFCSSWARWPNS